MLFLRHKSFVWVLIFICLITGANVGIVEAKSELYHCPMHPQVVSDKPGECPICHMRLVPSDHSSEEPQDTAHEVEGRLPVKVRASSAKAVGILSEDAAIRPLKKTLRGWGVVAHDPELFEMQIEFLRQERLNYERERDRTPVALKRGLTEREKIKFQFLEKGLSEKWVDELEKSGVPDKRLIYHQETSDVWVYAQFREKDAVLIKQGDVVNISVPALPGLTLQGSAEFIDGLVDEMTLTVRVRVLVKDAPPILKPNASIIASISADLGESLTVSEDVPLFTGKRVFVFVEDQGVFKPRSVVLGDHADGYYAIKDGVMAGEKVASSGNFFLDSESRLKASLAESVHEGHAS